MKKILLLLTLCFLVSCTTNKNKKLNQTGLLKKGVIVVGIDLSYPPFETVDKMGNPSGITIDILKELASYLGVKLEIQNTAWTGLIPGLQAKVFDIVMSSLSVTEERKQAVKFSIPYARIGLGMLFSKNSKYRSTEDLKNAGKNANIIVRKGTIGETLAKNLFPQAVVRSVETTSAMILDVSQGKSDVMIYDPLTLFENYNNNKNTTVLDLKPIENSQQEWAIAMSKKNVILEKKINNFLKQYKKQGKFEQLTDKYLSSIKAEFQKQNISFFFDNK